MAWPMVCVVLLFLLVNAGASSAQPHSAASVISGGARPDGGVDAREARPTLRKSTIEEEELPPAGAAAQDSRTEGDTLQQSSLPSEGRDTETSPGLTLPMSERGSVEENQASSGSGFPLIARITPQTPPQRVASLRLVEQGQEMLRAGRYREALASFEKAIAVDSSNPYSHYFVALAHHDLKNYQESFNFLDVAESLLSWHKRWSAEVHILRAKNFAALGFLGRADSSYIAALSVDPANGFALDRFTRIQGAESDPGSQIQGSELR